MSNTSVLKCSCKNEYQDKEYGSQQRVHNYTKKDEWRCTVCESTKSARTTGVNLVVK